MPNTLSMGPGCMPVSPSGMTISFSATSPGLAATGIFSDSIILAILKGFMLVNISRTVPFRTFSRASESRPAASAAFSMSLFFATLNSAIPLNFFLSCCSCLVGMPVRSAIPTTGYFLNFSASSATILFFHSGGSPLPLGLARACDPMSRPPLQARP